MIDVNFASGKWQVWLLDDNKGMENLSSCREWGTLCNYSLYYIYWDQCLLEILLPVGRFSKNYNDLIVYNFFPFLSIVCFLFPISYLIFLIFPIFILSSFLLISIHFFHYIYFCMSESLFGSFTNRKLVLPVPDDVSINVCTDVFA